MLLASASACSSQEDTHRLVVAGLEVNRNIVRALAEQSQQFEGFSVELVEQNGQALDMLLSGEADLALVENTSEYREGIASLLPIYSGVLHILTQGVDVLDLEESASPVRVVAGPEDSLAHLLMRRFLDYSGLAERGAQLTSAQNASSAAQLLEEKPDLIALFTPVSPDRVPALTGYRLYSISSPQELGFGSQADGLRQLFPQLRPFVIPRGVYPTLADEPVVTIAVDMVLVGRSDLEPTAVYDLIEALTASRPALAARYPSIFDGMQADFDPGLMNFPLHPGAQRFLDRNEPTVYERFADVVDAGVTVFLALLSGGLAIKRYLSVRRKNRIDEFYAKVLELRASGRSGDRAARSAAVHQVRALEEEAFQLLMAEKLSADESFRIFITLAHDVQQEFESSVA